MHILQGTMYQGTADIQQNVQAIFPHNFSPSSHPNSSHGRNQQAQLLDQSWGNHETGLLHVDDLVQRLQYIYCYYTGDVAVLH